jgi:hypothetical protein
MTTPNHNLDVFHALLMLLVWLVVGTILGAAVLFVTDILLGGLDDGVRLVETHLPRTPAARGLTI